MVRSIILRVLGVHNEFGLSVEPGAGGTVLVSTNLDASIARKSGVVLR